MQVASFEAILDTLALGELQRNTKDDGKQLRTSSVASGVFRHWNDAHPDMRVKERGSISAIDGRSASSRELRDMCGQVEGQIILTIKRDHTSAEEYGERVLQSKPLGI